VVARAARPTRRAVLGNLLALGAACAAPRALAQNAATGRPAIDATFLFIADIHACRMGSGLSPNCRQEGKTDENLIRHIAALNRIAEHKWPAEIDGVPTGLAGAGTPIAAPLGIVVGGDMTDDGGGQVIAPSEGTQLLQFSHRYQQGIGPDRVHFPVYVGLGNHDLDQDGPPPHADWYRRELRDYVEINHRPSVFFKPPLPATNYDALSDCYSWDWGGLHLVQLHRFGGDTTKGAANSLPWLKDDLATYATDGRPVMLFQHYGWDAFSIESWDPQSHKFDDEGTGVPHWWSREQRQQLIEATNGYNVAGIFHGHQHETPMIYRQDRFDLFKPKASFMGGFAAAHVTDAALDVVLAETAGSRGNVRFTNAFSKTLG
jgi:cytolysin (calcineurin-like family phosphatase)